MFLLYNSMYTYIPSILSLPATCTVPAFLLITERQAKASVLYHSFPPALCFTHGVCIYQHSSLKVSPPFFPSPRPRVHPLHLRLYSCHANRLKCAIFLDSTYIHALINDICFSLFDLLHSVWQSLGPSPWLHMTQLPTLFMAKYYSIVYMYHILSVHSSVDGHLDCFCKAIVLSICWSNKWLRGEGKDNRKGSQGTN